MDDTHDASLLPSEVRDGALWVFVEGGWELFDEHHAARQARDAATASLVGQAMRKLRGWAVERVEPDLVAMWSEPEVQERAAGVIRRSAGRGRLSAHDAAVLDRPRSG
jgi:hypothetical protein